ncbi:four helix bundle protein [Spirulina sp. CCNP1310]|uniref:four helix bundle protein n=1 Tax=Spirulina sp. CCNP1310 TaxID=3110249 RepID=UPI002B20EE5D|nr:four helix bundle protein [Spirulina sp. CCNP1310]MEA5421437.1 four helix bundle protein [Spirulina sp. CCNP1310]
MKYLKSYRDLIVWQKSMDLAVQIYEITQNFPAAEKFGIISQMRRAATSIPANITEGQARRTTGEFLQSLGIARGSLAELETFVMLSVRLHYLTPISSESILSNCTEISKMLRSLMQSLSH